MANPASLKPFKKGDPRINRKGRPRNPPALRELTLDIFCEPATQADGTPVTANGKPITKIEAIVRAAVQSKDPRQRQWAVELGYGKVPQVTELTGEGGGPVKHEHAVKYADLDSDTLRQAVQTMEELRALLAKGKGNAPADAG